MKDQIERKAMNKALKVSGAICVILILVVIFL